MCTPLLKVDLFPTNSNSNLFFSELQKNMYTNFYNVLRAFLSVSCPFLLFHKVPINECIGATIIDALRLRDCMLEIDVLTLYISVSLTVTSPDTIRSRPSRSSQGNGETIYMEIFSVTND